MNMLQKMYKVYNKCHKCKGVRPVDTGVPTVNIPK